MLQKIYSYNQTCAYIVDQQNVFQVLNAAGTDWSEADTAQAYRAWQANTQGGVANSVTTVVANTVTTILK